MAVLTTLQLPIHWSDFGLPVTWQTGPTCLVTGDPAWSWEGESPNTSVGTIPARHGAVAPDWNLDTVVMLAPDLDETVAALEPTLGLPRLRLRVENRPTVYYRIGPTLEIIESPVRNEALYGVTLVTTLPLDEVARGWRRKGHLVADPQPAIQPGRQIITVTGTNAGLAVLSADTAS